MSCIAQQFDPNSPLRSLRCRPAGLVHVKGWLVTVLNAGPVRIVDIASNGGLTNGVIELVTLHAFCIIHKTHIRWHVTCVQHSLATT